MMGRQIAKREEITAFSLDDYFPASHLLRQIGRFLDLSNLRARLAPSTAILDALLIPSC